MIPFHVVPRQEFPWFVMIVWRAWCQNVRSSSENMRAARARQQALHALERALLAWDAEQATGVARTCLGTWRQIVWHIQVLKKERRAGEQRVEAERRLRQDEARESEALDRSASWRRIAAHSLGPIPGMLFDIMSSWQKLCREKKK